MAKTKRARNIGLEILDGIRQIKRGEHGRIATLTSRPKFVFEQVPIPAWHREILAKRLAALG